LQKVNISHQELPCWIDQFGMLGYIRNWSIWRWFFR